jgi:hypothetical protein
MRRRSVMRSGPGLVNTVARTAVIAGTATAVSGAVASKGQQKQQANVAAQSANQAAMNSQAELESIKQSLDAMQAQQVQAAVAPAAPEQGASSGDDMIARLQQLGEMKSAGLLTDDEFQTAKARVIGM